MTTIPIQIDDATARAIASAPETTREQIALLVKGYVSGIVLSPEQRAQRFRKATDALGASAAKNGWNDELNEALLRGDLDDE